MKKFMIISMAIFFSFCLSGVALAFHGGGVAHCDGCHSMHAGSGNDRFVSQGPSLTNASSPSSVCLNCHDGAGRYHVSSADGSNTNEGGDFHWVKDNGYTYYNRGARTVDFDNAGHNVLSVEYGLANDTTNTSAPGGGAPSAGFACTSCHDPHGQVNGGTANGMAPISVSGSYGDVPAAGTIAGNYRLLYDSSKAFFTQNAPIARANSYDGASVQYGSGMSLWCGNCHQGFYTQTASGGMHPTDVGIKANYEQYVATGNFTGSAAASYDPLVPVERAIGDPTVPGAGSSALPDPEVFAESGGASASTDQVMCLTCHRAHASAFDNALRFDYTTSEFIAESWFTKDNVVNGVSTVNLPTEAAAPYYKQGAKVDVADDPVASWDGGYGHYQRSLCNKCHVKD